MLFDGGHGVDIVSAADEEEAVAVGRSNALDGLLECELVLSAVGSDDVPGLVSSPQGMTREQMRDAFVNDIMSLLFGGRR